MQHLYRHFAADGSLLYVGISLHALKRLIDHRDQALWFGEIATVTLEKFGSREAVKKAERKAIETEKPKHNVIFNTPPKEPKRKKYYRLQAKKEVKYPQSIPLKKQAHALDIYNVSDFDEIDGDEQLVFIWCKEHKKYEWHWMDREMVGA